MRNVRKRRHRRRLRLYKRSLYLAAASSSALLGLASRACASALPEFLARHAGDALWAALVYLLFRFVFPDHRPLACAIYAVIFSFGIEFSQLYRASWIEGLRSTTLGALVLGRGFLTVDLVRYTAGIAAAWAADLMVLRLPDRKKTENSHKEESR
ncbi:DUF2809 domain-containing protein [Saccharibacillus deserti]|uniref:ribosomal maturation YjgA family protein n=1 Tax=Saccharibacillus deserti TaxID=1634444 RepID=UPI001556B965|nr:DUF2809 domain-containing protein [Saccharibacillus deserti]